MSDKGAAREAGLESSRKIADNVRVLAIARGVTASFTLVTTIYLGRVLGPEAYGILSWGLATLAFFTLLPSLGLNVFGVREVARRPSGMVPLVEQVLSLRLILATLAYLVFLATVLALDKSRLFVLVVGLQGLVLFGYAVSVEWVFEGVQRMRLLATRNVLVATLSLGGTLALVRDADDVVWAGALSAAPIILGNLWFLVLYTREYGMPRLRANVPAWRKLAVTGLPIALSLFMTKIYASTDQVMLGLFRSEAEVGVYGAAYRLLVAAQIPATILLQAFMPTLSKSYGNLASMQHHASQFIKVMATCGFLLAAIGGCLASLLVQVFGTAYVEAAGTLGILLGSVALSFLSVGLGRVLIAWNRERLYLVALAVGAVFNVVANAILIPTYGYTAAAWTTLASEGLALVVIWFFHARVAQQTYAGVVTHAALVTALAVVLPLLSLTAWGLSPYLALAIALGVYALVGHATRLFDLGLLVRLARL